MRFHWAWLFAILLFSPCSWAQKQVTLKQATNLRGDPSTHNAPLDTLQKGARLFLLAAQPTNGFYHVRTADQKEGWVWSANVLQGALMKQVSRKLVRRPAVIETEPAERAAVACASDLPSCPSNGCSPPDSSHGLANQLKRRVPGPGNPTALTFDDFQSLQNQADSLVGENRELTSDDRAKLSNLVVSSGAVSEGDLVFIVGYMVGVPHPNT